MRNRRAPPEARTPYARPEQPPAMTSSEDPENPNWLSGLIYPAKMIASGAGKILSFFGPNSSSSSSSGGDSSDNLFLFPQLGNGRFCLGDWVRD